MSMYDQFKTDDNLEAKGVDLDYGDFIVTIARAGGGNRRFAKAMEAKAKPFRRLISTDTITAEQSSKILHEVYASAVVLNWRTKVDGELKVGIEGPEGDLLPFNADNVVATFKNLPDLFADIQTQANRIALFRKAEVEADSGN